MNSNPKKIETYFCLPQNFQASNFLTFLGRSRCSGWVEVQGWEGPPVVFTTGVKPMAYRITSWLGTYSCFQMSFLQLFYWNGDDDPSFEMGSSLVIRDDNRGLKISGKTTWMDPQSYTLHHDVPNDKGKKEGDTVTKCYEDFLRQTQVSQIIFVHLWISPN